MKFKSTFFALSIVVVSFGVYQGCRKPVDTYADPTAITILKCSATTFTDPASANVVYNGIASVPYDGGNGGIDTVQTVIASGGVTGLIATHIADTLAVGPGSLKYQISGKPASTGTATFPISVGGQSCSFALVVN